MRVSTTFYSVHSLFWSCCALILCPTEEAAAETSERRRSNGSSSPYRLSQRKGCLVGHHHVTGKALLVRVLADEAEIPAVTQGERDVVSVLVIAVCHTAHRMWGGGAV